MDGCGWSAPEHAWSGPDRPRQRLTSPRPEHLTDGLEMSTRQGHAREADRTVGDAINLIIPIAGALAVLFALYLARWVLSRGAGPQAMQDVAGTIFEGAVAFIRRQYTTIAVLAIVGAFVIGAVITFVENSAEVAGTEVYGIDLGIRTGIAFIVGAACSMASGIIGMFISVRSNVRTASAARRSLVEA